MARASSSSKPLSLRTLLKRYTWLASPEPEPRPPVSKVKASAGNKKPGIPRPANSFMVFRADYVRKLKAQCGPGSTKPRQGTLSGAIGEIWRNMSKEEKEPFVREAARIASEHKLLYPEYRFRPKRAPSKSPKKKTSPVEVPMEVVEPEAESVSEPLEIVREEVILTGATLPPWEDSLLASAHGAGDSSLRGDTAAHRVDWSDDWDFYVRLPSPAPSLTWSSSVESSVHSPWSDQTSFDVPPMEDSQLVNPDDFIAYLDHFDVRERSWYTDVSFAEDTFLVPLPSYPGHHVASPMVVVDDFPLHGSDILSHGFTLAEQLIPVQLPSYQDILRLEETPCVKIEDQSPGLQDVTLLAP